MPTGGVPEGFRADFAKHHPKAYAHMDLYRLSETELFVLVKRCGFDDEGATSTEVLARVLSLTPEQVEQVEAKAHKRLKH